MGASLAHGALPPMIWMPALVVVDLCHCDDSWGGLYIRSKRVDNIGGVGPNIADPTLNRWP